MFGCMPILGAAVVDFLDLFVSDSVVSAPKKRKPYVYVDRTLLSESKLRELYVDHTDAVIAEMYKVSDVTAILTAGVSGETRKRV